MSREKKVLVIGTGTIGEPLIGLFTDFRDRFEIDEVTFHKRTPLESDRAKLNHLMDRGARLADKLLQRPDRLIGLILLGNNLVNFSAASLVAIIALEMGGEPAVALGTLLLTLVVLIFSEAAPKTMAALRRSKRRVARLVALADIGGLMQVPGLYNQLVAARSADELMRAIANVQVEQ